MFELKVRSHFSAAHQLRLSGTKCENLHGHNWKVDVFVIGDALNDSGLLMDFGEIKQHVAAIMERLDHRFLNDLDFFEAGNPSSENIARYIATALQQRLSTAAVTVSRVTAWESDDAGATYYPAKESVDFQSPIR